VLKQAERWLQQVVDEVRNNSGPKKDEPNGMVESVFSSSNVQVNLKFFEKFLKIFKNFF